MKILFVASEMVPFCKTGGLADVLGSLPPVLAALGHEVHVMLPGYTVIDRAKYGFRQQCEQFQVQVGPVTKPVTLSSADWRGAFIHLIENGEYFDRPALYGDEQGDYYDNGPRFICFCRGVLEAAKCICFEPDIISAHDWQAGLIPAYLETVYSRDSFFRNTRTLFTIHNLGYQGNFAPWVFSLSGVPESEFHWQRMEYYGNVSFLKSGIVYSDAVSTVSEKYAEEITAEPLGFGMQGVLAERRKDLYGILNGIDNREWDPATDMILPARFSAHDLPGKKKCRTALLEKIDLPLDNDIPLFGIVSRLDSGKGFDILEEALGKIVSIDAGLVVLGTGTREHMDALERFATRYNRRIRAILKFDITLSHLIYGGADGFLMPSRYEPCGLGQMIAMRYGALPVVHATGGLADTVFDLDRDPDRGNGFSFGEYSSDALVDALDRAVKAFHEPGRARWNLAMQRGMHADFSWKHSAEKYIALFEKMRKHSG
ncbi:MAG: glycogen synthase GlgA [Candidatus Latescibacterota bacterium]